jgi:cytochrome P450
LDYLKPKEMGLFFDLIHESLSQRLSEEIQDGEESRSGRKDMFYYLFHNKDSETGTRAYTDNVLPVEASLLLTTALGATTTTLSAFCFYIIRNPVIYHKLVSEIRTSFISGDDIQSSTTLSPCRYLRACIEETLRMTPAAPGENMRYVLPGGQEIDGQFMDEGVLVGTSSWSLFHSEEFFGDPWTFRPERWIANEDAGVSAANVADAQAAFFPFSIGPVSCVGQKLARSILSIAIAKLVFALDVVAAPGARLGEGNETLGWGRRSRNVFQVRDATFALREGPLVQFVGRQAGH